MSKMESLAESNYFRLKLDGAVIVDLRQPTIDGGFVGQLDSGTFDTPIGKITVDLTESRYYSVITGIVTVSGEGLKRTPRGNSDSDIRRHHSAVEGKHRFQTGSRGHGCQTIGKDPNAGRVRVLEVCSYF